MADLAPVLIVMTIFATMGWIVHVFVDGRRRRERLKVFTEFHSRLIDRMGSAKEFAEFLQTTGGQNFLDTLSLERGHPADRIAKAVQIGIILTSVGLALFLATDRGRVRDRRRLLRAGHHHPVARHRVHAVGGVVVRAGPDVRPARTRPSFARS